jgi:predicted dehydrogenase
VTRFKVGLLGAGYIVQAHARALAALESVQMTAVCDVSQERASQVASSFGIAHVFTSVEQLISSDCDVVHVLLPPYLHEDVTRRLLEAGKSVLVEKPMGLSAGDCMDLAELAASRGLRLGVNHNFLFTPGYEAMRRDAASGDLGKLDHLERQLARTRSA